MRTRHTVVSLLLATIVLAAAPAVAGAHPDAGDLYVPWVDKVGNDRSVQVMQGSSAAAAAVAAPGSSNMTLVGNADKDGTINSDLAFWGNLAYAGNYGGFRILDISGDQPSVITDHVCNGPQNDVSVYEMGGKRFLFQSIDSGQTAEDCSSATSPIVNGRRTGYEGVRVFDVTNPTAPRFLDMIQTACGSHTHTLVPDGNRAFIYVASYPLATGITEPTGPGDFRACAPPHKKISIIEVSAPGGDVLVRPAREVPQRRHGVQPRLPGLPRLPGVPAKNLAVGRLRGRRPAVGRLRSGQPDDEQRGAAHPHQEPVSGRSVRVHPLGHRVVGRQDVRDHGRDRRRRGGALQRRGLPGRLLLLLRRGGARRSGAEAARPVTIRGRRVLRSASRTTRT